MPLRSEFVAAECGDQHATSVRSPTFMNESRLDKLRDDAWQRGAVTGRGVDVAGGPIPRKPGYYGQPVVRPPVWTWEIPIYFFVGGLGGMSAVIALGALLFHHLDVARTAMWVAAIASVLSPILLILDLGRPHLFINMLRVFKPQSAMSMGAWILTAFGMCVVPGLIALELQTFHLFAGAIDQILGVAAGILIFGSAIFGMLLATYTGVLIGATAIPAWFLHHRLLPIHFGTAGLGSAAALLELLGHRIAPLNAIGFFAAAVESLVLIWLSVDKHGTADRAIHEHASGWLIRIGEILNGPLAACFAVGRTYPFGGDFISAWRLGQQVRMDCCRKSFRLRSRSRFCLAEGVAQASCLWGKQASRLLQQSDRRDARRPHSHDGCATRKSRARYACKC